MLCASRGGDGWLWYTMGLIVLLCGGPSRFAAIGAAALSSATGIALFLCVKGVAGRKRPCTIEAHCWATPLPPDPFSFPSGHTITGFAVAVPLGLTYPSLMLGLLFCAFSVAVSRVLIGLHFVSDIIAGAAIGACLGYGAFCVVA
jgi:undecaprenyl-diphosphatase